LFFKGCLNDRKKVFEIRNLLLFLCLICPKPFEAIGGKQTTYLNADKYRVNAVLGYMNLNVDFYGIGNDAGDKDKSIPITQKVKWPLEFSYR
jgi:hypothetical protein